ncbi:MAG: PIN domain-containing protein [Rhodanobacteraceae bacterium]|nr:PIN domain-containing protein [Rhodanobacteraceae bacterium]
MGADAFIDSNVVIYLLGNDLEKANRAESLIQAGAICSVQVLNEVANVMRRKLAMNWSDVREVLGLLKQLCKVKSLTVETHQKGIDLAERFSLSMYDAMIVASALLAGCATLWSEDMHDGLVVDGQLHIRNPFGRLTGA